jgi:hypothetical protein
MSIIFLILLKEVVYFYLYNAKYNFVYFYIYNKTDSNIHIIIDNEKNVNEIDIIENICKIHKYRINKKHNAYKIILNIDNNIISENIVIYPSEYISSFSAYGGLLITIVIDTLDDKYNIEFISIYDDFDYESQGLAHHIKMDFYDYIWKNNRGRIKINYTNYYWEVIRKNEHLYMIVD